MRLYREVFHHALSSSRKKMSIALKISSFQWKWALLLLYRAYAYIIMFVLEKHRWSQMWNNTFRLSHRQLHSRVEKQQNPRLRSIFFYCRFFVACIIFPSYFLLHLYSDFTYMPIWLMYNYFICACFQWWGTCVVWAIFRRHSVYVRDNIVKSIGSFQMYRAIITNIFFPKHITCVPHSK